MRLGSRRAVPLLVLAGACAAAAGGAAPAWKQPELGSRAIPVISVDGLRFRDLDRDGRLTPYEDWRLSPRARAADLVSRMTLEEKAGAMMHPVMGRSDQVTVGRVNSVLLRSSKSPDGLARDIDAFQEAAETTRLGIPVTVSSDPRNVLTATFGQSVTSGGFSQWPDAPGFAAIGDPSVIRRFGEIAAREYRAVGITMALSPQADIASDPRWSRTSGTFGDDPAAVGRLAAAYVEGIQGGADGVTRTGVAAVVKHFAGYGAVKDGWDSHSYYGRFATFPGGRFDEHVAAFRPSFRAKVAGVMPTYSILQLSGQPPVAAAFNPVLLQDVLRRREGYAGLVLSDWSVTEDCNGPCMGKPLERGTRTGLIGKPWGVEALSRAERVVAAVKAGVDQIGFDAGGAAVDSSPIVEAVRSDVLPPARIDEAVGRIMEIKFRTGLFENPFADPEAALRTVGRSEHRAAARDAQVRSLVLLENRGSLLPLKPGRRVYLRGVAPEAASAAGLVPVPSLDQADLAIIRAVAPWQLVHPAFLFGRLQHEGDLDFKPDNKDLLAIREASARVPTIVTVYLERPAILTEIRTLSKALIANFGVSDEALLAVVTGRSGPTGRLPFELPASMAAVQAQRPDVPHDSARPLYRLGYGLNYRPSATTAR